MKAIIIGPSLSGKTTLVRYLRKNTDFSIAEIDEELTRLNKGEYPSDDKYKHEVLAPQVIDSVLDEDNILFFTNTDYFRVEDLKTAKNRGFKIVQLKLDLEELERRNKLRVEKEGYSDLSQWLKGMVDYQRKISEQGLVDLTLDASLPTEGIANDLFEVEKRTNT